MTTGFDPTGVQHDAPGAKLDGGKALSGQLLGFFANALGSVAEVGTFGARKYSVGGWQHTPDGINRYGDAGMRHWLQRHSGEEFDPDSGMLHLAHEAWNKLAELELVLRENKRHVE